MLDPEIKMLKKIDITNDKLYGGDASSDSDDKEGGAEFDHKRVLACLDDDCVKLLVYNCEILFIKHYAIDLESDKEVDQVNLVETVDILFNY